MLYGSQFLCEFCGAEQVENRHYCDGHRALLKLQLLAALPNPALTKEQRLHLIAECILRGWVISDTHIKLFVENPVVRLKVIMAYEQALTWIVRQGGHRVCQTLTCARLGLPTPSEGRQSHAPDHAP